MKPCTRCHEPQPEECFGFDSKDGIRYRRRICNMCRSADMVRQAERRRNREINELLRWPTPRRLA